MEVTPLQHQPIVKTCLMFIFITTFTSLLILFPNLALDASVNGLHIWLDIVFPALFPFLIASELIIRFGIAHFAGHFLDPLMRPLFGVRGIGAIALFIGMISGYPAGAKVCADLRAKAYISQTEGERLLAFTNNASPLFIFGVIAISFYSNELVGIYILLTHYLANLFAGLSMRFYLWKKSPPPESHQRSFKDALRTMHRIRLQNKLPIGHQFSHMILQSVRTLCIIGGYIILFSVISQFVKAALSVFFEQMPLALEPLLFGFFEMTIGIHHLASTDSLSLFIHIVIICLILSFNGLSVHAQVLSLISESDLRYRAYFLGRVLHAFWSLLIVFGLSPIFLPYL